MSLKIALVGNCQVRTYAVLLQRAVADIEINTMEFSESSSRDEENRKKFLADSATCDFIFVQNNGLSFTRDIDFIELNGKKKVFSICNFFFRGLQPDICYVGNFAERFGFLHYNSILVLGAYLKGMSVDECLALFTPETFAKMGLFNAFEDSLRNLADRDARVDFPGSEIVRAMSLEVPIFRTFNHPTSSVLAEYLYSILRSLEIPHLAAQLTLREDPLYFMDIPVYDFVAEYYKVKFRTTQLWRYNTNDFMSQRVFVERSYKAYSDVPGTSLVLNSPEDLRQEIEMYAPDWLKPADTI